MRVVLIVVGVLLVAFGALDALWTTLWPDRIYLTGSLMATLGTGNSTPNGGVWEIASSLAGLDGLFPSLMTDNT